MKVTLGGKEIIITKNFILVIYLLLVIVSKIVRYTVMKTTLVDAARGDEILYDILYNNSLKFTFSSLNSSLAFNNAAVIFKSINFWGLDTYIQFEIYISIVWNILVIYLISNLDKIKNNLQGMYLILTISVLNIFNFTIAKEPIQILYFFLIYFVLNRKLNPEKKFILSIAIILFSALTFRSYYVLFAFFTMMIYYIFKFMLFKIKKVKLKHIILVFLLIAISICSFMVIAQKISPSSYHELLTVRTHSSNDAATKIKTIIPGSTSNILFYTIEYIILLFRMMIPVELLSMGVIYSIFAIYQILITYFIIRCMINYKKNTSLQNLALCIYIGFVLVSATFEPDFGSWVRHEASAFPIVVVLMGLEKKKILRKRST